MFATHARVAARWAVALALVCSARAVKAHEPIVHDVTIDENESLLIGAIDMTSFTLDNAERAFYLKGSVEYPPLAPQRLPLETVRGFPEKLFFFVKLRPLDETQRGSYTLAVEIGYRRFRNVVTIPVDVRRCAEAEDGKIPCGRGLTNMGSIVVGGSWPEGAEGEEGEMTYTFERQEGPGSPDGVRASLRAGVGQSGGRRRDRNAPSSSSDAGRHVGILYEVEGRPKSIAHEYELGAALGFVWCRES